MNCIQPSAPAEETLRLVPKAVSTSLMPARTAGPCGPSPYFAAACWKIGISTGGTPAEAQVELGSEGIASAVEGVGAGVAPLAFSPPSAPLPGWAALPPSAATN